MVDVSADDFLSATKCFLKCFHIDKFRETQQDASLNLLKGKDVLVSQPTASRKLVIFQSFLIIFRVVYECNQWLSIFSSATDWKRLPLSNFH